MNICLLGYMGSGKSTIGRILAKKLNFSFLDLDSVIEQQENQSISNIFTSLGEIKFRKLEHTVLQEVLTQKNNQVIALGGGTPVFYNNMEIINELSHSVYLQANIQTLVKRLSIHKENRPLIAHLKEEEVPEFIAKHLFERNNYYLKAKHKISVDNVTEEEIVDKLIQDFHHQNLL